MNPTKTPLRRRIVPLGTTGGIANARIKSLSRDNGTRYNTRVDLEVGVVRCDCADFLYRHAQYEPSVRDEAHHCKHLKRAIEMARRHGELAVVDARPCLRCGVADAEHDAWDESGNVVVGYLCNGCIERNNFDASIEELHRLRKAVDAMERWRADASVPGYATWNVDDEARYEELCAQLNQLESDDEGPCPCGQMKETDCAGECGFPELDKENI